MEQNSQTGCVICHGQMEQWHNKQKESSGSFWADRFHSSRIQDGVHLAQCLLYIDLNMVRAGAVDYPAEWTHSAYRKLTGRGQRCRFRDGCSHRELPPTLTNSMKSIVGTLGVDVNLQSLLDYY
jgi:hypothetical protein